MISRSFTTFLLGLATLAGLSNAKYIVSGYYNSADVVSLSPGDISSFYDIVMYSGAFQKDALPSTPFQALDETNMKNLVKRFRDPKGTKVLASFGGFIGSRNFSDQMATDDSRTKLAASMVDFMKANSFDGIDVAWVNRKVDTCYKKKPEDTANFLELLKKLRATMGQGKLLTAGAPGTGLVGVHGEILADLKAFNDVLDYLTPFAIEYLAPGYYQPNIAGPIAPLWDHCMPDAVKLSASASVKYWIAAGLPAEKLLLGITTWGFSYTLSQDAVYTNPIENGLSHPTFSIQSAISPPKPPSSDDPDCGLRDFSASTIKHHEIAQLGGKQYYDNCLEAPIVIDDGKKQLSTFENTQSFQAKARFARANGLAGINVLDINGDFDHALVDAANRRLCEPLVKDDHPCNH